LQNKPSPKWFLLILAALTSTFAIGAPAMSLAVLFNEITADLNLDLVQIGLLWSIGSLPAIFTSPLVGALDDRFGPKRILLIGTFLVATACAMRGLAINFISMLLIIILIGILLPLVSSSSFKICAQWFPPTQLGLANGILSMGLALGFLIGSLLSANVLSPWLGGWRNVMFFYGGIAALFCIPWFFAQNIADPVRAGAQNEPQITVRKALGYIGKLKNIWLLGIAILGTAGCMQGAAGYLSLYLRGAGWTPINADGALSLLSAMSLVFILPITFLSDRLRSRKGLLLGMVLLMVVGTALMALTGSPLVWLAVIVAGIVKEATTALLITMAIETDGVGPVYAGTASGIMMFFLFTGNLISPPLGNKLAALSPSLPFLFWAGMATLGLISLAFAKTDQRIHKTKNVPLPTIS
jgi:predicted MFS family arabinose efflux permease